jgi:hypothetical protein
VSPTTIDDFLRLSEPEGVLYHYTSLGSLTNIVTSGEMFASDIAYLNDAAEAAHTLYLLNKAFERVGAPRHSYGEGVGDYLSNATHADLRGALRARTYVVCFTREGNLLSQWRGYCPPQRGISVGFRAEHLKATAKPQGYHLRECIYDEAQQAAIADFLVQRLLEADHPTESGWTLKVVHQALAAVMKSSAVLKHPSFREEREWRLVSEPPPFEEIFSTRSGQMSMVDFREGKSMLIPYRRVSLPRNDTGGVSVEHVLVGPTLHPSTAVLSVQNFLSSRQSAPARGVEYCNVPLREA